APCQTANTPSPDRGEVFLQHAETFQISSVAVHPNYDVQLISGAYVPFNHDFAVITLGVPVSGIAPSGITLTAPSLGTSGKIVGFGLTSLSASDQGLKRHGNVTTGDCPSPATYATHVCWTFGGAGSNICPGDSGGPLFISDLCGRDVLAGIHSVVT